MGMFIVEADGSAIRRLPTPEGIASWSPDGSRIAVHILNNGTRYASAGYDASVRLYTMASDGSDIRALVEQDRYGNLSAANGRPRDRPLVVDQRRIDEFYGCHELAEPGVLLKRTGSAGGSWVCDED